MNKNGTKKAFWSFLFFLTISGSITTLALASGPSYDGYPVFKSGPKNPPTELGILIPQLLEPPIYTPGPTYHGPIPYDLSLPLILDNRDFVNQVQNIFTKYESVYSWTTYKWSNYSDQSCSSSGLTLNQWTLTWLPGLARIQFCREYPPDYDVGNSYQIVRIWMLDLSSPTEIPFDPSKYNDNDSVKLDLQLGSKNTCPREQGEQGD